MITNPETSFKLYAIIKHLQAIPDVYWITDRVRTEQGNCFFGHLFAMGKTDKEGNELWDWFESAIANTYMIYPINDGKDARYPQENPKARVLAYLHEILWGREKTTLELMDESFNEGSCCVTSYQDINAKNFETYYLKRYPKGPLNKGEDGTLEREIKLMLEDAYKAGIEDCIQTAEKLERFSIY